MKVSTRLGRYVHARTLPEKWALMSKARKRYAEHLVRDYGYPVVVAIQQSYIFGYSVMQVNMRTGQHVNEIHPPRYYGFR